MSSDKILILGGSGFIGSNFARHAIKMGGNISAYCGPGGSKPLLPLNLAGSVDVSNLNALSDVFRRERPQVVLFSVSRMAPRLENSAGIKTALLELRGVTNCLECAAEYGVSQFMYCSSGGTIYGDSPGLHREDDACSPKSLYSQIKLQCEQLIEYLSPRSGLDHTILRIGNPYGPGQSPFGQHGVISVFLYRILSGQSLNVFGSLSAAKEYVYVDDVSAAIFAARATRAVGTYNISASEATPLGNLISVLADACGKTPTLVMSDVQGGEVASFRLDISRAADVLGWTPTVDLASGVGITQRWLQDTFF